ncbi:hypothetical protein OAP99_02605 [Flavobacteriaceae bacterium]|nr:hypothetical protein [Flavobacteriaceae bacterium]
MFKKNFKQLQDVVVQERGHRRILRAINLSKSCITDQKAVYLLMKGKATLTTTTLAFAQIEENNPN